MTPTFSLFRPVIAAFVIALAAGAWPRPAATTQARPDGRAAEVRGMWVLRQTLASPAAINEMVAAAAGAGINALFVQVRARGDAYYASAIEPRGSLLTAQPESFDPLATVIRAAHARGIAVHAWVNVGLVSDATGLPAAGTHVIRRHPEWLMIPRELAGYAARTRARDGGYLTTLARWTRANTAKVEGLYVSPIPRDARVHATALVRDLTKRYAIDGLHLDYVRYPHDGFDYSAAALAEFRASLAPAIEARELAALDARAKGTPTLFADRYPQRWDAFRRARVTALVAGVSAAAREERPGITISAAVLPDPAMALDVKLQDWPEWAARGLVDALCPMAYAQQRPAFTAQIDAVRQAAAGVAVWTGIGAYRLSAAETASRILEARRAGSSGVLLFSYDSVSAGPGGRRYLADVGRAVFSAPSTEHQH